MPERRQITILTLIALALLAAIAAVALRRVHKQQPTTAPASTPIAASSAPVASAAPPVGVPTPASSPANRPASSAPPHPALTTAQPPAARKTTPPVVKPYGAELERLLATSPPSNPCRFLPRPYGPVGGVETAQIDIQVGREPASRASGALAVAGARASTQMYGIRDEAEKFVYVLDRSGSTGGPPGGDVLTAEKQELLASLAHLGPRQQFQIIFYNEAPRVFHSDAPGGRLQFATPPNKESARQFIQGIVADGGTAHDAALSLAIRMQPDVIYFLSDADRPGLTASQLERFQRMAAGIRIHAIEFGEAPHAAAGSFMRELAGKNDGQYKYIPVTELPRRGGRP